MSNYPIAGLVNVCRMDLPGRPFSATPAIRICPVKTRRFNYFDYSDSGNVYVPENKLERRKLISMQHNPDVTVLASSPTTKYQIFKYQNHAYGIQFHIEIKDTTVSEWGCVPEYKTALEKQLGLGALEKFDIDAKNNMSNLNNYSKILYENFKKLLKTL